MRSSDANTCPLEPRDSGLRRAGGTPCSAYPRTPHKRHYAELCIIASPYSHPDPAVRRRRFRAACRAAGRLLRAGLVVYSPIAHSAAIAACGLDDMDHDFWMRVDRPYLEWCNMVMVLMLWGWHESRGVDAELAYARAAGKPVSFISPADVGVRDVPTKADARALGAAEQDESAPAARTGAQEAGR